MDSFGFVTSQDFGIILDYGSFKNDNKGANNSHYIKAISNSHYIKD